MGLWVGCISWLGLAKQFRLQASYQVHVSNASLHHLGARNSLWNDLLMVDSRITRAKTKLYEHTEIFCLHISWYLTVQRRQMAWQQRCVRAKSHQSCLTLCDPMDHIPPGCSVHEIPQAWILEWVAMPSSRGSFQPRNQIASLTTPALAGGFFTTSITRYQ